MDPGRGSSSAVFRSSNDFSASRNTIETFAKESGGTFFPVTFEGKYVRAE